MQTATPYNLRLLHSHQGNTEGVNLCATPYEMICGSVHARGDEEELTTLVKVPHDYCIFMCSVASISHMIMNQ